jgi:hypothetical protein
MSLQIRPVYKGGRRVTYPRGEFGWHEQSQSISLKGSFIRNNSSAVFEKRQLTRMGSLL